MSDLSAKLSGDENADVQLAADAMKAEVAALRAVVERLSRAVEHAMVCDYPEEVDFRCAGCNEARAALDAARHHKEGA